MVKEFFAEAFMLKSIALFFSLLCTTVLSAQLAAAQSEQPRIKAETSSPLPAKARPKIGVALEGGGALGLAHIGVLQWFEDHHIPVDYIAGTSMGGLVGGLYATGKSPAQLQALVDQQQWDIIIGGETPFKDLSFRRKEDHTAYPNSIILGLKHGLAPPSGLNQGQQITALIDRETLPYSNLVSFDDLPIPFRCVATELVTGKEVVFQNGDLEQALRATMAIPGVFAPVRNGERVYVDGGLVGNLPTQVVRNMGADIVIGIHLEIAPVKPDDLKSLFDVLGRSVEVVIRENEIRGLAGADLVISVPLQNYSSLAYSRADKIISEGKEAAAAKEQVLRPYSLPDAAWNDYLSQRDARKLTVQAIPQFVKVEGANPGSEKSIERFLRPLVGKPIDTRNVDELMDRLAGNGRFARVGYRMAHNNGQDGLLVSLHESTTAPPTLQLGFEIDGSEVTDVNFTQAARLTFLDPAGYRSEWRTDFSFGNAYGVNSEFYKPFSAISKWFIAPRAGANDSAFRIYDKNNPIAEYRLSNAAIGADLGYAFDRFTQLRAGYELGFLSARLRLGRPDFGSVSGRAGNTHLQFRTDHTDDPIVPRQGYLATTNFRFFDSYPARSSTLPALDGRIQYFQTITEPSSLFFSAQGGTDFNQGLTSLPLYFLGGPDRLSAYGIHELFGNQFYLFQTGYLREIFTLPPFIGHKVFAIATYEAGKMYDAQMQSDFPTDVAVSMVAETAFGPMSLGASIGDTGHRKWFFQLGRVF
jgi:NTE family protein